MDVFRKIQSLFCILIVSVLLTSPVSAEEFFKINTSIKPPYSTLDEDGAIDQLLEELFKRAGFKMELVRLPPARALQMINTGQSDAEVPRILGMSKSYPNMVVVPESFIDYHFVALTCRKDISIKSWNSLANFEVGYIIGWKIFEQNVPSTALVTKLATPKQLLHMVARNRINIALYERHAGTYLANELGIDCLHEPGPPLATVPMYLYVNKRHADKVNLLTNKLRSMKKDGTYQRILSRALQY